MAYIIKTNGQVCLADAILVPTQEGTKIKVKERSSEEDLFNHLVSIKRG